MRTLFYFFSSVLGSVIALVGAYYASLREFDRQVVLQDHKTTIRQFGATTAELRERGVALRDALRDGTSVAVLEEKRMKYRTAHARFTAELTNFDLTVRNLLKRKHDNETQNIVQRLIASAGLTTPDTATIPTVKQFEAVLNQEIRPGVAHVDACLTAGVKQAFRTVHQRSGGRGELANSIESLERVSVPIEACTTRVPNRLNYCITGLVADLLSAVNNLQQPAVGDVALGVATSSDFLSNPMEHYEKLTLINVCTATDLNSGAEYGQMLKDVGSLKTAGIIATDQ